MKIVKCKMCRTKCEPIATEEKNNRIFYFYDCPRCGRHFTKEGKK